MLVSVTENQIRVVCVNTNRYTIFSFCLGHVENESIYHQRILLDGRFGSIQIRGNNVGYF